MQANSDVQAPFASVGSESINLILLGVTQREGDAKTRIKATDSPSVALNLMETPPARQKNSVPCAGLVNNLRQALGLTFVYDGKPDITTVPAGGVKIR